MTTVTEIAIALVVTLLAISAATSLLLGDHAGRPPYASSGFPEDQPGALSYACAICADPVALPAEA